MKDHCVIAIDGPAGAGKSTVARMLADRLKFLYLDTGAMYRAVTLYYAENNIPVDYKATVTSELDKINIEVKMAVGKSGEMIFLNGRDVTDSIRTPVISDKVSRISVYQEVRNKLVELQRRVARNSRIVIEGRDIGSVVFPDADVKFYIDANLEVRAKRRYLELVEKGCRVIIDDVIKEIEERDRRDSTRELSPLMIPEDAVIVDTSFLTTEEVVERMYSLVKGKNDIYS